MSYTKYGSTTHFTYIGTYHGSTRRKVEEEERQNEGGKLLTYGGTCADREMPGKGLWWGWEGLIPSDLAIYAAKWSRSAAVVE